MFLSVFQYTASDESFATVGATPSAVFSLNPQTYRTVQLATAPAPEVLSIEPNRGQTNLTTDVTITGLYFAVGAVASIGTYELVTPTVVDAATITGLVRSSIPFGCYDVVVRNPDDQEGRLTNGFAVCDANGNCPECAQSDDTGDDDTSGGDKAKADKLAGCGC